MDGRVASILHRYSGATFDGRFTSARYVASNVLKPGDTISITVYESGGSSLFGSPGSTPSVAPGGVVTPTGTGAGVTTVPPQTIEADGTVSMPYVGRIVVTGRTPGQVGHMIEEKLRGKVIQPQVVVSPIGMVSNTATVGGEVNQPRPIPLTLRGERLLDVIAAAGGAKYPSYETYVRVVRGHNSGNVLLQTVVNNPSENIIIRPNDEVFVTHNARTFAVLGATQKVSQYTFDTEKVTLAEAIARAGGPVDTIGDPSAIYLFRFEPWALAKDVLPEAQVTADGAHPDFVPILYRINLSGAEGYFVAQSVQMRDKDVVLITNAEATQLQKLMAVVRGFTGVAYDLARPR
ncbi:MAG: polysaccharide biosynthesis/export family protein [Pseudolabrys sp.]